jgi:hypothetical protein
MYYSKIKASLLAFFLVLTACDVQKNHNGGLAANTTVLQQNSNTNLASSNDSNKDKEIVDKIKSRYQTKPRRKKISFLEDCRLGVDSNKNWKEVLGCADALESVKTKLQAVSENNNCSRPMSVEDDNPYEVIDSDQINHKIKNSEETNIKFITKKLTTTIENIRKNSNLEYQVKLKIGQEIKYQKAHWVHNFNPAFYPLSTNKYLIELACWTAAYNESNVYLLYDESALPAKISILEFPSFSFTFGENKDEPEKVESINVKTVGGRLFNPKTKELIVFIKGNGNGDFGEYARYSFVNDTPKLEEFRAKFKEDGISYGTDEAMERSPKAWKQFYPN